jgi:DNA mismatch repair protein MutL
MTKKIIQLDAKTINQIAAGEVVENPASVIKELVENSIDANANQIVVEVVDGGFSVIKITDDGDGFDKEDLLIALRRHTTSKLKNIEDLWKIGSMGFRGEALASIAAISEFSILSRSKESIESHGYLLKNFPFEEIQPAAKENGTTLEVRSLFYNVPARKAFQKSSAQSLVDIIKVMTKISLGFPQIELKLIAQGKEVFFHRGKKEESFFSNLKKAIDEVLDKKFMEEGFTIDEDLGNLQMKGFLGGFNQVRSNRMGQHLFINNRAVFSPVISQVVKNGYGTRINSTDHPVFVLHITLPFSQVDVNVHPQKKEVRLKEEKEILEKVKRGVIKTLLKIPQEKIEAAQIPMREMIFQEKKAHHPPSFWPKEEKIHFNPWKKEPFDFEEKQTRYKQEVLFTPSIPILGTLYHYLILDTESLDFLNLPLLAPITLINTQALRFKLHYEEMKKRIKQKMQKPSMQTLLFPSQLSFTLEETIKLEKNLDLVSFFGIELHQVGKTNFSILSLMEGILEEDVKEFIEMILKDIDKIDEQVFLDNLVKKIVQKMKSSSDKFDEKKLAFALNELKNYEDFHLSIRGEKIFHSLSLKQLDQVCQ